MHAPDVVAPVDPNREKKVMLASIMLHSAAVQHSVDQGLNQGLTEFNIFIGKICTPIVTASI